MAIWTRRVCIVAALISLILATISTSGLRAGDLPFLGFLMFPYLLMGLLSSWQRSRRRRSAVVFSAALLLSLAGISLLGFDSVRFHTVPEHRMVQRFTVIVVPLLQSAVALVLALVLQLCVPHRRQPPNTTASGSS
jgi:peptidoglycan/LPS O-acetylase OafA/YrhL